MHLLAVVWLQYLQTLSKMMSSLFPWWPNFFGLVLSIVSFAWSTFLKPHLWLKLKLKLCWKLLFDGVERNCIQDKYHYCIGCRNTGSNRGRCLAKMVICQLKRKIQIFMGRLSLLPTFHNFFPIENWTKTWLQCCSNT